ncbi:DUF1707 SHOCT-like domain-containing protein [Brevibacterium yomogidense]|uniref:DUF1707 SHOCT-like domain-containing protein n=1 Tax=Brevibacterium yomogidense TaxID=946573 RepID=UPI0018DF6B18|nr:DUF1707 domain-containing protein [Brevibacterium yomogidense]
MTQGPIWSRFRLDPRRHTSLRASDEDRDVVRECLGEAYADGRLDRSEFDDRLTAVDGSRFLGDLLEPLSDLVLDAHPADPASEPEAARTALEPLEPPPPSTPSEIEAAARAHHAKVFRASLSSFVGASAITTLIWLATGLFSGGFAGFWPIFVMLGTGIGVISTASRRSQIIEERRRALTRQAREYKELEGPQQTQHDTGSFRTQPPPASRDEDRRDLRRRRSRRDDEPGADHEPP